MHIHQRGRGRLFACWWRWWWRRG